MILYQCDYPDCYLIDLMDGATVLELEIGEQWKVQASIKTLDNMSHICTKCVYTFNYYSDDENYEALEENNPDGFERPYLKLTEGYNPKAVLTWDRNEAYFSKD